MLNDRKYFLVPQTIRELIIKYLFLTRKLRVEQLLGERIYIYIRFCESIIEVGNLKYLNVNNETI